MCGSISLSDVNPTLGALSHVLDKVEISVSYGRHFTLNLGGQKVETTMKEITAHFNQLKASALYDDSALNRVRDDIIILNFRADAMLKNSDECCAKLQAKVRRFFGGTSEKNYHLDQLLPLQSTLLKPDADLKRTFDATLIPDNIDLGKALNEANRAYRTAYIEHDIANLLPNKTKNNPFVGSKEGKRKDAWEAYCNYCRTNGDDLKKAEITRYYQNIDWTKDARIELFNTFAETYPLTACYQLDDPRKFSTAEKLAIMARVGELNKIIKKAFQEIESSVASGVIEGF